MLDQLVVRPITPEERPRWNELVSTHHYLKNATLVGAHLCYVAEYQGTWLALLGWAAPARHLRPRDALVGWSKEQLACRRHFLANNTRFCILADPHQFPNLASRALGLNCARICHCRRCQAACACPAHGRSKICQCIGASRLHCGRSHLEDLARRTWFARGFDAGALRVPPGSTPPR